MQNPRNVPLLAAHHMTNHATLERKVRTKQIAIIRELVHTARVTTMLKMLGQLFSSAKMYGKSTKQAL